MSKVLRDNAPGDKASTLIGADTETAGQRDGRAVLVCTPRRVLEPKSWESVARWLVEGRGNSKVYGFWNLAFDAQALMLWLPRNIVQRIAIRGRATHGNWRIEYVPGKRLRVTLLNDKRKPVKSAACYDLAVWYGSGLDAAAKKWLRKSKLSHPDWWFEDFGRVLQHDDRRRGILYCRRDALLAQHLGRRILRAFAALGLNAFRAASPASVGARRWSKSLGTRGISDAVMRRFEKAYHGARVEVLRLGMSRRVSYFDIHSAYPWAASGLRTLDGAEVRPLKPGFPPSPDADYAALKLRVRTPLGMVAGPLPVRTPEGILFPVGAFEGWYTLQDYQLARDTGCDIEIREGFEIHCVYDDAAFPGIEDYFQMRMRAKAEGDEDTALALKLLLNGLYGKMAEHREQYYRSRIVTPTALPWAERGRVFAEDGVYIRRRKTTRSTNYIYASAITSIVRARLFRDAPPEGVIAYMTDGVFLNPKMFHGKIGAALGDWNLEGERLSVCVLASGVYGIKRKGEEWETRWRGFSRAGNLMGILRAADEDATSVGLPVLRAISFSQLARGSIEDVKQANILRTEERICRLDADCKRVWKGERTAGILRRRGVASLPFVMLDNSSANWRDYVSA